MFAYISMLTDCKPSSAPINMKQTKAPAPWTQLFRLSCSSCFIWFTRKNPGLLHLTVESSNNNKNDKLFKFLFIPYIIGNCI